MVRPRKKLGEMLIDSGIIEQSQLEQALAGSRNAGMKLGQHLIRQGVVNEDTIVRVISEQVGIKQYSPNDFTITPDLSKIMSSENARRYQAVPVHKSGNILTVAMVDPLDITAIDYIEVLTDTEVDTVICTEKDFNLLLNSIYGAFSGKGSVLDNIQEMGGTDDLSLLDENRQQTRAEDVADMTSSLQNMAEEAPVIKFVNSIITQAVMDGASDIHISPEKEYVEIRFRVDGKLHDIPAPPKNMFLSIVSRLKILANLDISISRIPQDGRFTVIVNNREINIRTSTIPTIYGENLVLRLFDTGSGIYSLGNLGVSSENIKTIEQAIKKPYGMILSTGPTGSGKSTCLFSMLKTINSRDLNIMTLEDPVEYRMEHIRQGQLNRKAGMTFAGGLRAILRQDPDVIMVGEIRDSETAGVAVQAALWC
jgi:type IV pilus assembly protein PilB